MDNDPSRCRTAGDRGRDAARHGRCRSRDGAKSLVRTWRETSKDNAGLVAAGVAFYAFIAIVPTLGAIVLAYGLIATPATVLLNMQSLAKFLPGEIATLIADQLIDVVTSSSQRKGFGIAHRARHFAVRRAQCRGRDHHGAQHRL